MGCVLLVSGFLSLMIPFGHTKLLPQEEQQEPPKVDTTKPQWVVIYKLQVTPPANKAEHFELRLVVRANSEGEATLKSVLDIQNFLAVSSQDKLEFVEAQQKK